MHTAATQTLALSILKSNAGLLFMMENIIEEYSSKTNMLLGF